MTAAEHLNNLNNNGNKTVQVEKEFNHAIQYLNKIKARYADDANTYKQFLDILQTYHKEQRHSHDVSLFCVFVAFLLHGSKNTQVYVQVQLLFADAPDLLAEFKDFLPEAVPPGMSGPVVQSIPGSSSWPQGESPPSSQTKKIQVGNKRSRKPARPEKDTTPVPSQRSLANPSRVCLILLVDPSHDTLMLSRFSKPRKLSSTTPKMIPRSGFRPILQHNLLRLVIVINKSVLACNMPYSSSCRQTLPPESFSSSTGQRRSWRTGRCTKSS